MTSQFAGAALSTILVLAPALRAEETSWTVSPLDSFANFTVKHLMVSTVHGSMGGLKGTVLYDPNDPSGDAVDVTLEVSTLNTGVAARDDQVKRDYFDIKEFPWVRFKSMRVFKAGPGRLRMTGNLTIKNVTKQVVLEVQGPSQMVKDSRGRQKIGLTATTKISRRDFGIIGTALDGAVETGGMIVSDDVSVELDIELMPGTAR